MLQETKIVNFSSAKLGLIQQKFAVFDTFFPFQLRISVFNSFTVICSCLYSFGGGGGGTPIDTVNE